MQVKNKPINRTLGVKRARVSLVIVTFDVCGVTCDKNAHKYFPRKQGAGFKIINFVTRMECGIADSLLQFPREIVLVFYCFKMLPERTGSFNVF